VIWSFIKIAIFIALAAAVAFGANYVIETGGEVTIAFGGRELPLSPFMFVTLIVVGFVAMLIVLKLVGLLIAVLKFVNGDETAISRYFDRNRERKGYEALKESITALAGGDGRTAMAKATRAEKLLSDPAMTRLVVAQAAEMSGQGEKAEAGFKALLADDKTRFVGVQGLMRQQLEAGKKDTALKLAEKAFQLNPTHVPTLETLFQLQTDQRDWAGARKTLQARIKARALPKDVGKRREAVLSVADARVAAAEDRPDDAREAAIRAIRLVPGLVPGATLAGSLLGSAGDMRKAGNAIQKAWSINPHPDLAAAFAGLVADETPDARLTRFRTLLKQNPEHPETKMLAAELYLSAEDFPAARKAIGNLAETDPTARAFAIMAAIERGSGADEAVVSGWLARAVSAPRDAAWICDKCRHIHGDWEPVCENCHSFDTLQWDRVPVTEDRRAIAAATLPLVVAGPEPEVESNPKADDAETVDIEDAQTAS